MTTPEHKSSPLVHQASVDTSVLKVLMCVYYTNTWCKTVENLHIPIGAVCLAHHVKCAHVTSPIPLLMVSKL